MRAAADPPEREPPAARPAPDLTGDWRSEGLSSDLPRDQEQRWRAGQRVQVEDYLRRVPALAELDEVVLDLIHNEFLLREELNERPRPEEYLARFPDRRKKLEELFAFQLPPGGAGAPPGGPEPESTVPPPGGLEPGATALPERIHDRYAVVAEIGRGGFGVVYRGRDEQLKRDVAIKVPHPRRTASPADVAAFLTEAQTLAKLNHRGVVQVYDFGQLPDGRCYLVSEYVPGGSLADRLKAERFTPAGSAEFVAAVADALHHAHKRALVHRDVKPGNILIGDGGRPVVADFGLALRDEDYGRGPTYAGTLAYMSPEQACGEGHRVDARTDVYGLGAVLYELLTGRRPFQAADRAELRELVARGEPRPPRQFSEAVPRELDRICLKAMGKRAADRYSTAADLADDLAQWLSGRPATPLADPPAPVPVDPAAVTPPPASSVTDEVRDPVVPRGLRSFQAEDADFFLDLLPGPRGRGGVPESVRFWKALLEQCDADQTFRVGLIYGPSGCGKSSLVKAGVMPRLAGHVTAVYVEATADDTEARLLAALRKRWPDLPPAAGLADALARLRRGLPAGTKLVLVLDQFEQWLHASPDEAGGALVAALRQCDGTAVQALLLVRDDFWMAVSRFVRELEVPLVEGRNSAPADLFDPRHARKVLIAFGRAFGALPAGELAPDHERFLDRAVAGLTENGRVIPVRLALFAEMVKRKPWTPATWRAAGGAEGVGVAFLDETFGPATAPLHHRVHERAARAVLARLLPEPGADLKGPMQPRDALLAASGYADRPREFDELLRILDAELRLVTATDRAPVDPATDRPPAGPRCYQLTHDYLVPALRQWLTRKQGETRRGRAELRLAERTAVWVVRPETRHLPSGWEWARIRLLTRRRDWTPPQRAMMRRAGWHHALRGLTLAVALVLLGLCGWEYHARSRARTLRDNLLTARTADVPTIIDDMAPYRRRIDPLLREAAGAAEAGADGTRRLHLSLALLPSDPDQLGYLYERLLDARPEEFAVVRGQLAPHKEELAERLWAELEHRDRNPNRRFRAACALAAYTPADRRWAAHREMVAAKLAAEDARAADHWVAALEPVRDQLLPPLAAFLEDEKRSDEERRTIADLFSTFAAGRGGAFAILEERLAEAGRPKTQAEASLGPAKGRANVAAALLRMGRAKRVWSLLAHSQDPTTRSYLIERIGTAGVKAHTLERRLSGPDREPDVSIRRAIILALGSFGERPESVAALLLDLYETDPDPGTHSAAEWTLRQWGRDKELAAIIARLKGKPLTDDRGWCVNKQGQTMSVVRPDRIAVGIGDAGRVVAVGHRFAVATKEVTVAEFQRFRPDYKPGARTAPHPDCPANLVTWYQAAEYCNWLSEQDRIPKDEWCYEPNAAGQYAEGMSIKANYLKLRGYRLPTEAEWEFACRAGATTAQPFGAADVDLLSCYARWVGNAFTTEFNQSFPVGGRKPNDFGLFDMNGNVSEWCQEVFAPQGRTEAPGGGSEVPREVVGDAARTIRGGSHNHSPGENVPSFRSYFPLEHPAVGVGFRPAQSVP